MADVYVNSDELREIAQNMKLKANNIMEAYQNEASAAILMGSESIQISGLDTTALLNSLSKIFNNLNGRIVNLSDFLTNVVANEYDSVSIAIKNEFDNNFANEISKLLGISVIGTGVGGVKIIDKTPISDIVSGKIDNSKIISIREARKIIKKNKPPIYEIPPQPKPKLETMNDGGGSNPVSDKSSIALPLKDSIRDSILSTRSTKATAVTQQETNM